MNFRFSAFALFILLFVFFQTNQPNSINAQSSSNSPSADQVQSPKNLALDDTSCIDDAMLVFDGSTSMADPGYNDKIPRIIEARKAMRKVLPQITNFRKLGLIVFGPGSGDSCQNIQYRLAPALGNAPQIIGELENLRPSGNTPLSQSVQDAANLLQYRTKPAVVVLVTDGEETCSGKPCSLALDLLKHAKAITVHVIGFKASYRYYHFPSPESEIRAHTQARCLAETTGGKYFSAETTEELQAALTATLGCPVVTRVFDTSKISSRGYHKHQIRSPN